MDLEWLERHLNEELKPAFSARIDGLDRVPSACAAFCISRSARPAESQGEAPAAAA